MKQHLTHLMIIFKTIYDYDGLRVMSLFEIYSILKEQCHPIVSIKSGCKQPLLYLKQNLVFFLYAPHK